jgi:hypothetical protein
MEIMKDVTKKTIIEYKKNIIIATAHRERFSSSLKILTKQIMNGKKSLQIKTNK